MRQSRGSLMPFSSVKTVERICLLEPPQAKGTVTVTVETDLRHRRRQVKQRRLWIRRHGRCLPLSLRYAAHPRSVMYRIETQIQLVERKHQAFYDTIRR